MGENDDRCMHCGRSLGYPGRKLTTRIDSFPTPGEEKAGFRQTVRYLCELAVVIVLALVLIFLNRPSRIPESLRSSPIKDLVRIGSDREYARWTETYFLHITGRSLYILRDMRTLDRLKFTTSYIQRFKREYLDYDFPTAEYRYSPYSPEQRVVAENPAHFVEVQIQKFESGAKFIGPVDISVFNKSPFPLYDLGINLVYEATEGPNRGRKIRGFILIQEPVEAGTLKIYENLHHMQPVQSFEGVDRVSFYVTGAKVGR